MAVFESILKGGEGVVAYLLIMLLIYFGIIYQVCLVLDGEWKAGVARTYKTCQSKLDFFREKILMQK
ncbi:MAG TPA: hypothetical protein PK950_00325 [Candidatus Paceibacterota bacterium]|nr:hypothetical protein [Candidatus Paceibacterota bacterium]